MRVIVPVTISGNGETVLEGESRLFCDGPEKYLKGCDSRLMQLGFWLEDWRYVSGKSAGTNHKGRVFIPWTSVLYIREVTDEKVSRDNVHPSTGLVSNTATATAIR